jgi:hypothetical protein
VTAAVAGREADGVTATVADIRFARSVAVAVDDVDDVDDASTCCWRGERGERGRQADANQLVLRPPPFLG